MKKRIVSLIGLLCLVAAGIVLASDGALWAIKRSSTGVLEVGFDSSGNLVAPGSSVSGDLTVSGEFTAGFTRGVQTAAQTNNSTLTVTDTQVDITGTTNAESLIVNLTLPSAIQIGQMVYFRNTSTQDINLVYGTGTTNTFGPTGSSTNSQLFLAAATNLWVPLSIPVISSALQALEIANGGALTNLDATKLESGNAPIARLTNACATIGPYVLGNIPVAAITNAAKTVGAQIGGNIPVAAITNAGATFGPYVLGNIPIASVTNAAGGGLCIVTNLDLDGTTNIITYIGTVQRNQ
jgi:hypothetical protein